MFGKEERELILEYTYVFVEVYIAGSHQKGEKCRTNCRMVYQHSNVYRPAGRCKHFDHDSTPTNSNNNVVAF